jgi:hypothetical protein
MPTIPITPAKKGGAGRGNLQAVKIKPTINPVPRDANATAISDILSTNEKSQHQITKQLPAKFFPL